MQAMAAVMETVPRVVTTEVTEVTSAAAMVRAYSTAAQTPLHMLKHT